MPKTPLGLPKLQRYKPRNLAAVRIDGRFLYLGPWGDDPRKPCPAAQAAYDAKIREWLDNGRRLPDSGTEPLTVEELAARFWTHAESHYVKKGRPTSELHCYRMALRPVRRLYGASAAENFGPAALKACRAELVAAGMVRRSVNKTVSRIRSVFRWAAAEQLVDPSVVTALEMVAPLLAGRTEAAESEPVAAVPESDLAATLAHLAAPVRAMVEVQLWSGCRPGEVVGMRGRDIDTAGLSVAGVRVWVYRPADHKGEHLDKDRVIFLGPKAQEVIHPWLKADAAAPLFASASPRWRGRAYSVSGYRQAIERACVQAALADIAAKGPADAAALKSLEEAAGKAQTVSAMVRARRPKPAAAELKKAVAAATAAAQEFRRALAAAVEAHKAPGPWHPHRLRHNAAERLEAEHGLEAAQYVLGHSMPDTTRIYSQAHRRKAAEVMGRSG